MTSNLKSYIAPKSFYKKILFISVPLALNQILSSCMGIVDTMMVSWIGNVNAVGTAAQIENLMITIGWGVASGVGIYCAQFYGAKRFDSLKKAFGLSLMISLLNAFVWMLIVYFFGYQLMSFFINDISVVENALKYLNVVYFSYIPLSLGFCFAYVYRTIQKTQVPLIIGAISMLTNVVFNYLLIFGKFGFPQLGVVGAAYGTLIAQSLGLVIHVVYAYFTKQEFFGSFQEMFGLDREFVSKIIRRIYPLIVNEIFFGLGNTLFIKAYGLLGPKAMDAYYIGNNIANIFFFVTMGVVTASTVLIGEQLGKHRIDTAKEYARYMLSLAFVLSTLVGILIIVTSPSLVSLFGTLEPYTYHQALNVVRVFALRIALRMFNGLVFSMLRAGGDSKFLSFLDAGMMWLVGIPLSFIGVFVFGIKDISILFLMVQLEGVVRIFFGIYRYKSGIWAQNLTNEIN
ncbi:MAG: MATE family efflux transporter [Erysipelotrichaceae bacterium]